MRSVLARVSGTCLAFLWSTVAPCQGGIGDVPDRVGIGQATRIIFNEKDASLSFPVRNGSDSPYLLRTYIVNPQTQTTAKQLYVAPEVLRLSSHSTQSCRIVRLTNDFRSDRESLFFLRGLFIPASYDRAPKDSRTTSASFTVALQINLKLFYRPRALAHSNGAALASETLAVTRSGDTVRCRNTTPYHVTLSELKVQGKPCTLTAENSMLAPFATQAYLIDKNRGTTPVTVTWRAIDDYGNLTPESKAKIP